MSFPGIKLRSIDKTPRVIGLDVLPRTATPVPMRQSFPEEFDTLSIIRAQKMRRISDGRTGYDYCSIKARRLNN